MKWIFGLLIVVSNSVAAPTVPSRQAAKPAASIPAKPAPDVAISEQDVKSNESTVVFFGSNDVPKEQEKEPWYVKWQDPVGIFTGLLVAVTFYQARITQKGLKDAERAAIAATQSADAATKSADAAIQTADATNKSVQLALTLEIPRLVLFKLNIDGEAVGNIAAKIQSPKARVALKNYGKTPAFLESQAAGIYVGTALPPEPNYSPFAYDLEPETVVEPYAEYSLTGIRPFHQPQLIEDILAQRKQLWVFGYVQYKDFTGQRHITRFCKQMLVSVLDPEKYQFSEAAVPNAYLASA